MAVTAQQFQKLILNWFDKHGRKHLPWQVNKTPYRVWVSEIMLQQTQVATVIPYYLRFLQRFPDVKTLADAHDDEVLHLWAGLGYYSRARNLQRAARMIMQDFAGEFPNTLETLQELPGIGPSTAGAILAIAFNQQATILDGNVKRVLARLHAVTDPINEKSVENKLWDIAVQYSPKKRVADYTQAMMDLGATLCTRGKPACERCPLLKHCCAHELDIAELLPKKKATREIPVRTATFLVVKHGRKILLQKRPPMGIWGGLWSVPEISGQPNLRAIKQFCRQQFQQTISEYAELMAFRHTFSHYHLDIHPILIELTSAPHKSIMEAEQQIWYDPRKPEAVGLPKPTQTILRSL